MQINSLNLSLVNFNKQNVQNKKGMYSNLSPLAKDTVSFGASVSVRKLVEDLKKCNPNGQFNIKQSDAELIYKYFGYELENGTNHKVAISPYRQKYSYKDLAIIDPANASSLIRGIQMADEFNGELILFRKKPTEEEVQRWKKIILEGTPNENAVNQYAIDHKDTIKPLQGEVIQETTDVNSKEQNKTINQLKAQIGNVLDSLKIAKEDFQFYVDSYDNIKSLAEKNKIELPQKVVQVLDEKIEQKRQEFSEVEETLGFYRKKLDGNNMLSDDEVEKINSYKNSGVNYSEIKNEVDNVDNIYEQEIKKQEAMTKQILGLIDDFDASYILVTDQLTSIREKIDEVKNLPYLKKGVIQKLNTLYTQINRKLSKMSKKIDKYRVVETQKTSISQLNTILEQLNVINKNGLGESIPELVEINSLISKEVTPFITMSDDEKAAKNAERVARFKQKLQLAQQPTLQNKPVTVQANTTATVKSNNTQPQQPTTPTVKVNNTQPQQPVTTPVVNANTNQPKQPVATGNQAKIVKPSVQNTAPTQNPINKVEDSIKEFKSKVTEKITPLPLPSAQKAVSALVNSSFDVSSFDEVLNGKVSAGEMAKDFASSLFKTKDFDIIKNSARFAFLNGVYNASTNQPEEIFTLNGKETRELYSAIQSGKKEIDVASIKISLGSNFDINAIDETFNDYNIPLNEQDNSIGLAVSDEILKYAPSNLDKEKPYVIYALTKEGSYYKLLLDKDCPAKLKATLLENFWKTYDSNSGTNYTPQVMANYNNELKRINDAEMQKKKLDSINTMDWSL